MHRNNHMETAMHAYFDCFSGLAGDMTVAALLDAGADWDQLHKQLQSIDLHGFEVERQKVDRAGIAATHFLVHTHHHGHHHEHHHRSLSDILAIIDKSPLSPTVRENAAAIFRRLGAAEAKVHNCDIEKIHFHEVGAVDSIVDIVGTCIGLELLGIDAICFPAVPVGSGTIQAAHGTLPVPAPATAELLTGFATYAGGEGELTTPTGAAIATALGRQVPSMPEMTIRAIGYGAGTRQYKDRANVLRVIVGESAQTAAAESDLVVQLATQLDDQTGEETGYLTERLWNEGALDVVCFPITMKKGRPGVMLEVLGPPEKGDALAATILHHSSTFGLRRSLVTRQKLSRESIRVDLPDGQVAVKIGYFGGRLVRVSPEYEDCRALAVKTGAPLREIYRQAVDQARRVIDQKNK